MCDPPWIAAADWRDTAKGSALAQETAIWLRSVEWLACDRIRRWIARCVEILREISSNLDDVFRATREDPGNADFDPNPSLASTSALIEHWKAIPPMLLDSADR
jgi:hypothetical protein